MTDNNEYLLPEGVGEVKASSAEYYKHSAGTYKAYFGKLRPKYKDLNGKKCNQDDVGAALTHFVVRLWLIEKIGDNNFNYLKLDSNKKFIFNVEDDVSKLYFPLVISYMAKEQWKNIRLFDASYITDVENSKIVKLNPANPTEKIVNFNAFPLYYGMPCLIVIENGKQTGAPYVAKLTLSNDINRKLKADIMNDLENFVENKIIENRNANNNNETYTPPSVDIKTALDDILGW